MGQRLTKASAPQMPQPFTLHTVCDACRHERPLSKEPCVTPGCRSLGMTTRAVVDRAKGEAHAIQS